MLLVWLMSSGALARCASDGGCSGFDVAGFDVGASGTPGISSDRAELRGVTRRDEAGLMVVESGDVSRCNALEAASLYGGGASMAGSSCRGLDFDLTIFS